MLKVRSTGVSKALVNIQQGLDYSDYLQSHRNPLIYNSATMAIRALESRLERMSVNDENEPTNGGSMYQKPKVNSTPVALGATY